MRERKGPRRESLSVWSGVFTTVLVAIVYTVSHFTGNGDAVPNELIALALGSLGIGGTHHVARSVTRGKEISKEIIDEIDDRRGD